MGCATSLSMVGRWGRGLTLDFRLPKITEITFFILTSRCVMSMLLNRSQQVSFMDKWDANKNLSPNLRLLRYFIGTVSTCRPKLNFYSPRAEWNASKKNMVVHMRRLVFDPFFLNPSDSNEKWHKFQQRPQCPNMPWTLQGPKSTLASR